MKTLVFGSGGQLGKAFCQYFDGNGSSYSAFDRSQCDITQEKEVRKAFDRVRPHVVLNCAAYNLVDDAEDHPALALGINAEAPEYISRLCADRRIKCVHFSTDYVFNGAKGTPYVESDRTDPLSVYAKSKRAGEEAVLAASKDHLVFRVSWVVGPGKQNFLYKVRQWVKTTETLKIAEDEVSVPTFTPTIVRVVDAALKAGLGGLHHLTNGGQASRYEFVKAYLDLVGLGHITVMPVPMKSFVSKARRPGYSPMSNENLCKVLGVNIPDWREDLKTHVPMFDQQWRG